MNNVSPIRLKVWADFACFTRPEMKVERVSYDVLTPSAARGVLEAIYWKPQLRWVIERLHVLNPIRFTNIRRNEIASKIPVGTARRGMAGTLDEPLGIYIEEARQQRAATILRDVAYVIEARIELLDPAETIEKHFNVVKRRAEKGQYFHHPYLGCREFPCDFEWIEGAIPSSQLAGTQDLGYLLHDMEYRKAKSGSGDTICRHTSEPRTALPHFFRATMIDGVIDVPPLQRTEEEAAV